MISIQNRVTHVMLGVILVALLAIIGMLATTARGGPLDPPGSPGSTPGVRLPGTPISQPAPGGFPIVISQPGNYYLTGNIQGEADVNGIAIDADDVTIDLGGFTLKGLVAYASAGPGSAIIADTVGGAIVRKNITIRNGAIDGWTFCGIGGALFSDSVFEDLHITGGRCGIEMGGGTIVRRTQISRVSTAGGYGIKMYDTPDTRVGGIVQDSFISEVDGSGIVTNGDSIIQRNTVYLTNLSNTPNQSGVLMQGLNITVTDNVLRWSLQSDLQPTAGATGVVTRNVLCAWYILAGSVYTPTQNTVPGGYAAQVPAGGHPEYDPWPDMNTVGSCT